MWWLVAFMLLLAIVTGYLIQKEEQGRR